MSSENSEKHIIHAMIGGRQVPLYECPYDKEEILEKVFWDSIDLIGDLLNKKFEPCLKRSEVQLIIGGIGLQADALLFDEDGIPTVIELKLLRNRDMRRKVLGQLLEYMTGIYLDIEDVKA